MKTFEFSRHRILNTKSVLAALVTLVFLEACSPAQDPEPAQIAESPPALSAEEARANAKEAYFFTYGLVMNYRTMYRQAIMDDGQFGKWLHLDLSTPADQDIVTPNNDTPYSYAWVDLRAEPWVLTMPEVKPNRFYTSQWDDLWAYVLDNTGSVNDGNGGVSVLLASPSWKGTLPEGIDRVIRGESEFLGTLTRTQILGGMQDLPRVKEIQQSYKLQSLSDYLGTDAPPSAPAIEWLVWTEDDEKTEKYWDYVAFGLQFITPHPDDHPMYEKMASIGLKPGTAWEPEKLDPSIRKAMQEGLEEARAEMLRISRGEIDPSKMAGTREKLNPTYLQRAIGVYMGIFLNVAEQSIYFSIPTDADGKPFNGSNSYTLTFTKDLIPPVKYFWSITMYKLPERFLVDNPIDRHSIGSSTPGLKTAEDGSITLYFSTGSPGTDNESNWLPTSDGSWWIVLRTYGPQGNILSRTYTLPPVEQVD